MNIIDRQQQQQQRLRMDMTQLSNFVMGVNYAGETMSREGAGAGREESTPLYLGSYLNVT